MIKYYRNGLTIFKIDLDNNEIVSVTNHPENKAVVYSFGTPGIAKSMNDSMTSQLGVLRPGGNVTVEVDENEFNTSKLEVKGYFVSGSIDF